MNNAILLIIITIFMVGLLAFLCVTTGLPPLQNFINSVRGDSTAIQQAQALQEAAKAQQAQANAQAETSRQWSSSIANLAMALMVSSNWQGIISVVSVVCITFLAVKALGAVSRRNKESD